MGPASTKKPSARSSALLAVVVLVAGAAAAGCGGDGEQAGTSAATTSTSAVTTTAAAPSTTEAPTTTVTTTTAPTTTTEAPEPFDVGIALAPDSGDAIEVPVLAAAEQVQREYPAELAIAGSDDPAADLRGLAAAADLVVVFGPGYDDFLAEVAAEHPDVMFVRVGGFVDAPNVVSAQIDLGEAALLVGAAAALTTETGSVAFLGAMPIPSITNLEAGFTAGVAAADPSVEVTVAYLGEAGDWALFSDDVGAETAAAQMYADGVDVVFHGAGAAGSGVFRAAAAARAAGAEVWAIGVDFDQAAAAPADIAPVILTSAVPNYEAVVWWAVEDFVAGRLVGGERDIGVAEGVVGYTTTGGWLAPIAGELDAFAAGIADGSIVVPQAP